MKAMILFILVSLPTTVFAEEVNLLAGRYSSCVRWTTYNGMETSKKFDLAFGLDNSLEFTASFYQGSGVCGGTPLEERAYRNFQMIKDSGNRRVRLITAQDVDSKLYFKFSLSRDSAIIDTTDSLADKPDPMRTLLLDRIK